MRLVVALLNCFFVLVVAGSGSPNARGLVARHSGIAVRMPFTLRERSQKKRCAGRRNKAGILTITSTITAYVNEKSTSHDTATSRTTSASYSKPTPAPGDNSTKTSNNHGDVSSSAGGMIRISVPSKHCPDSGATAKTTSESGPNGSIDFLNCGIDAGGWTPPPVDISDVVVLSLSEALNNPDSPFKDACAKYTDIFNKYGKKYGIPPIFLASFAMQESSCQRNAPGPSGEQGLMQITREKCKGAPGGDCCDPDFNIGTAAKYFADTLAKNNGNLLLSLGGYNGWAAGMTYADATQASKTSCCSCQKNLDYLHQFLNGWCQNINVYGHKPRIGKYFNLDKCD